MKNKNGFTMIEILGVVVILALISAFSIPAINTLSRQAKQNKYNNFLKIINRAADTYIEQNFEKYNNTTVQYIYVKKLIENGYISDSLVNPQTKEDVINENGIIIVTKNIDKTMTYEYSLNEQVIIYNIEDLIDLAINTNSGNDYRNKTVILTRDLDFNDLNSYRDSTSTNYGDINGDGNNNTLFIELTTLGGFNPIGNNANPFKGTFVGDGNTINNLLINRTTQSEVGLFGVVDSANISGLTLKGTIDGGNNTGLLIGKAINNSEIIDITTECKTATPAPSISNIGGVIGYADNIVLNNINSNPIINVLANNVGGIVGNIVNSNTTNLKTNGTVESNNSNIGGIFGISINTVINNVESNGKFKGDIGTGGIVGNISESANVEKNINNASVTSTSKAGGLFGIVSNSTIKNCYNVGDVSSTNYTGGLIGEANGSNIELNYSTGIVRGTSYIGGLIGVMNNSTINNNYNLGNVIGTSKIGGLVGSSVSSNINRSYMAGNIIGDTEVGGLLGIATNSSNLISSYYNSDNTTQDDIIGTNTSSTNNSSSSLTETEMTNQSSFVGWDFINIWGIVGNTYPTFKRVVAEHSSYILTINPNGGIWNLSNSIITSNVVDGTIMTINEPTREGYIFLGWTLTGTGSSITNTTFIMGKSNTTLVANWLNSIYEFSYIGNIQTFNVPHNGWYQVELWGAQGGSNVGYEGSIVGNIGGLGGYTKGKIYLLENEILNIVIGGAGSYATSINNASTKGYNGGGMAGYEIRCGTNCMKGGGGGGGATDIRYNGTSLNDRIMVASGGGGAANWYSPKAGGAGGNLIGNNGEYYSAGSSSYTNAGGGSQIAGGNAGSGSASGTAGIFGVGGDSYATYGSGGGGGYYGGGGGAVNSNVVGSGAGGSSFISGYAGVNAIISSTSLTPTNNTIHYSGKYFIDGKMEAGVNSGNGKAKIIYLSDTKPNRTNTKLNNVRYIKDCINGSNVDSYNIWTEIQAIYNSNNVAYGKVPIGSSPKYPTSSTQYSYNFVTDGMVDNITDYWNFGMSQDFGLQCITIDLGQSYNLDEIAIWHYWRDGRIFYSNNTYVSSDNNDWTIVKSTEEIETSNGKRISAYEDNTSVNSIYRMTNLVTNGSFENGTNNWQNEYNATFASIEACKYYGAFGLHLSPANYTLQEGYLKSIGTMPYISGHIYYASMMFEGPNVWTQIYFPYLSPYPSSIILSNNYVWTKNSLYINSRNDIASSNYAIRLDIDNQGLSKDVCIDGVMVIDLTATFGSGNEPTKEWCDTNLEYFDGVKTKYLNH